MWDVPSGRGLAVAMFVLLAAGSGCAAATDEVRGSARQPFPMLLTARSAWTESVRTAKVRVWADQAYRAQHPQWKEELDDDVAYANRVLAPMLGVALTPEYRAWEHRAQGGELAAEIAALAKIDPGDDAVWVIGVTAGPAEDATSFEQLGTAQQAHVIVRGCTEADQRALLDRAFPAATADERAHAALARRRHQTTAALLHALAHTLGAQHEPVAGGMLNANYSPAMQAVLTESSRGRMLQALDERLGAAEQYREAENLLTRGDAPGAADALGPVLQLYPARVQPRVLRCRIELAQRRGEDAGTIARCDEAAASSVDAAVAVAKAQRGAGDGTGAQRTLAAAEEHVAAAAADLAAAGWLAIAAEYRELGAVTRAENAVTRAGADANDHRISAWAATTRARYGIPRDGARWNLTIDNEAEAVTAVRNAISLVNASNWDAATRAIDAAEHRWPALPGVLTARCALEFRRDAIAAARRLCERALAQGGSSWALYVLGTIEVESHGRSPAAGIAHLREVIARDPELTQAWQKLARVLAKTRAAAELDQLRRDYRARFGSALVD
jgi:hypothetical protein